MEFRHLHDWPLTYAEAVEVQLALAGMVSSRNEAVAPRLIAGIDARYDGSKGTATGAVVVVNYPDMRLREVKVCQGLPPFPYVPGLLSFRECPVIMEACRSLTLSPDLVLVDGQGIAHPRRIGLASHVGLLLDRPTIGCAKSRLCGKHEEPGPERGACVSLMDGAETIGAVLRTRSGTKPVYVSIGHRVDLSSAIRWSLACCTRYRIPEPLRLAHLAASGRLAQMEA